MKPAPPPSTSREAAPFVLLCPRCRSPLADDLRSPCRCGRTGFVQPAYLDLCERADPRRDRTQKAYEAYSKFYAPLALLVYWWIWRGRIRRHIAFFREILGRSTTVLDIGTGDGSLTRLALFSKHAGPARKVLAIDLSPEMIERAAAALPPPAVVHVRGDAEDLPLADGCAPAITCFGSLHGFTRPAKSLAEMRRVLAPGAVVRGSLLLRPRARWRQKLVEGWIRQGYLSHMVEEETLRGWVAESGLRIRLVERYGDVLLFELDVPAAAGSS